MSDVQRILSGSEWQKWLDEQNEQLYKVFESMPDWLISLYQLEKAFTRDYVGREILELLQNAADAAAISKIKGEVRIELDASSLIIANTGAPFSPDGVASLQTSHLSPKRHEKRRLIGNKGLGFRAILNWSLQPIILSHDLSINFSPEYAAKITEEFASRNEKIKQSLQSELEKSGIWCSPLLLFPRPLYEEEHDGYKNSTILKRCWKLRALGYDTVIGMPFDNEIDSFLHAVRQIKEIDSGFLIFTDALERIIIKIENEPIKEWVKEPLGKCVVLHESILKFDASGELIEKDNVNSASWEFNSKNEIIPIDYIKDRNDPDSCALVVARPLNRQKFVRKLYSFFPTSVDFPIELLCHATLELEQNRKRLQESDINKYILERLALFILKVIEEGITGNKDAAWEAIDAIADIPFMQDNILNFKKFFTDNALLCCIFPTIARTVISGNKALLLQGASQKWLPSHVFPNVIELRNEHDWKFFLKIGVPCLSAADFLLTIENNAEDINKEYRAKLIFGIKRYLQNSDFCASILFLDSNGVILSNNEKFYHPGGQIKIKLPAWCKIKFIDSELWHKIIEQYDANTRIGDIVNDFEDFGLQEYSLQPIVRGIIRDTEDYLKALDDSNEAISVRLELLSVMMNLYKDSNLQSIPALQSVYIPTQSGEWRTPSEVYFGVGFDLISGKILQELFQNDLSILACPPESSGLESHDKDLVIKFYSWLGVAKWPRLIKLNCSGVDSRFRIYVTKKLIYPITFEDALISNFPDEHYFNFHDNIESFEYLDEILKGPYPAIVAWLAKDPQFGDIQDFQERNGSAYAYKRGGRKQLKLAGTIPSYILWKIGTTQWIPTSSEEYRAPEACFLGDSALEKFFPSPLPLGSDKEAQFQLTLGDILKGFGIAGVIMSLGHLDSDKIYEVLLALPKSDPEGKRARSFYRWLLAQEDFSPDTNSQAYINFCSQGMVLSQKEGNEFYAHVKKALHVDVEGIPPQLIAKESIALFPKKRGSQKIRKIFGVETIDKASVNEIVESFETHIYSDIHARDYKKCLKYIMALRQLQSSQQTSKINAIQRTQLELVSSLTKKITFKSNTTYYKLEPWDFVIQNDTLYILYEDMPGSRSLLAEAIGNALAYLCEIADGAQFSRIFECDEEARQYLTKKIAGEEYEIPLLELLGNEEQVVGRIYIPFIAQNHHNDDDPETNEAPETPITSSQLPEIINIYETESLSLVIAEVPHEANLAPQPQRAIPVRVGSGAGNGHKDTPSSSRQATGDTGELLAFAFEEAQGRFPLLVSHITGLLAPGCDILSFSTDDARATYLSTNEASRIDRFIEVKVSADCIFELGTNQISAASMWKERYYAYCFRSPLLVGKNIDLFILQAPLSKREAHVPTVRIDATKAKNATRFAIMNSIEKTPISE